MNKIIVLSLLVFAISCGKLPEDEGQSQSNNRIGDVFSANPNETLSASDSLLVSNLCNKLKTKQGTLLAKYYGNPSATFNVKTFEKTCDPNVAAISLTFLGKLKLQDNNVLSLDSNSNQYIMLFNDIVTNTHQSLEGFCSATLTDDKLASQFRLGTVIRNIAVIPNNNQACLATSGFSCLSVATAFEQSDGTFKTRYEDIFVLDRAMASEHLEVRRDFIRACDSGEGFSIRSQYLK